MGWNSRQGEEALLRESPELSSGSRSETERSVGDELSNASAPAGPGVLRAYRPSPGVSTVALVAMPPKPSGVVVLLYDQRSFANHSTCIVYDDWR